MNTSALEARAQEVAITRTQVTVRLKDGRTVSVPLTWFPKLLNAKPKQRAKFELIGDGEGIHWPDIDEDLSVAGLLRSVRSPNGQPS